MQGMMLNFRVRKIVLMWLGILQVQWNVTTSQCGAIGTEHPKNDSPVRTRLS